ncbi:MAG: hypothetical protein ACRDTF_12125, partial [Pseudonocardiaceae bacterium]
DVMRGSVMKNKTPARIAAVMVLVGVTTALLPVSPALALGNNRTVERGCGHNYVSSGLYNNEYFWAQTQKVEGQCAGRLSVAFELDSGYRTQRVYGDSGFAWTSIEGNSGVRYGLHWGCDDCNVTKS